MSAVSGHRHSGPGIVPPRFTNFVAVVLFFFFGAKMLKEAYEHQIHPEGEEPEELKEVADPESVVPENVLSPK